MKWAQLIGRIFFGMIFVMNGIMGHFMRHAQLTEYAAAKGVPMPGIMVYITGIMIVLGGLSVILGYKPKIGLWLLVAFLFPVAFIMHNFWAVGAEQQMAEMSHFLKDSALGGASLMMLYYAADDAWPMSLGGSSDASGMPGPSAGPDVEGPGVGGGASTSPGVE